MVAGRRTGFGIVKQINLEHVVRMKTISSPIQHWRGVCLSSVLGCMMLTTGMTVSSTAVAQATESSRTLATGTRLPLATNAPDTYTVKADGRELRCEPAHILPMAQRYFLF